MPAKMGLKEGHREHTLASLLGALREPFALHWRLSPTQLHLVSLGSRCPCHPSAPPAATLAPARVQPSPLAALTSASVESHALEPYCGLLSAVRALGGAPQRLCHGRRCFPPSPTASIHLSKFLPALHAMALPVLSFSPGLRVQDEFRGTFGVPVSSSRSDSFLLVAAFGRCKFRL